MKYRKPRKIKENKLTLRENADCGKKGIPSDTDGSYVGTGIDGDKPVQDADDL